MPFAQTQELDGKIQDVYKRIQTERKVIEASEMMRQATNNQDVIRRTDNQIRVAQRSLSYFEATLRQLQSRKQSTLGDGGRQGSPSTPYQGPSSGFPMHPGQQQRGWTGTPGGSSDRASGVSNGEWDIPRNQAASPIPDAMPKAKNYTNLGQIRSCVSRLFLIFLSNRLS
jgi:classical protein kinase C alpha type